MLASGDLLYAAYGGLQIYCANCPRLSVGLVGAQALLKWPASATNYSLETASNLPATQWQPVPGTPQPTNDFYQLLLAATNPAAFFRLRGQ